jgi:predicted MFS family arabinose efflux permease
MGLYRGLGSASFAVGAVTGGWVATRISYPSVFVLVAGCYLAAAATMLFVRDQGSTAPAPDGNAPQPPQAHTQSEPLGAPAGYGAPSLKLPALFLAGVFIWTATIGAAASMWPNAMSHLGYDQQTISSLWGLAALVELPGMAAAGMLSDVVGRAPLLALGGFGVAFVFLGYAFVAQWLPALIGVQAVRGLAYASYTASAMTFAAEHGDRRTRGSVSGIYTAATAGGQLTGMLASGLIVQVVGFTPLFLICAGAAVVSGLCFLGLRASERNQEPTTG